MKNKITRSLIVFALLCVTAVTLMSFCACQNDDDIQPRKDIPHYDSLSAGVGRIYINEIIENWDYSHEIEIVNALSDLEKFNILGTSYSEEYFENHVILLIMFRYASSDNYSIEFIDIAVKDDKFYPIFATNAPIQEAFTADEHYNLYLVGVDKRVLDYEFEEILVINRRDVNFGSINYKGITSVFK